METISGLPNPDFFPRLTDLTYTANRMATQNTDFIAGIPIYSPAAVYSYDNAGNIVSDGLHTDYFYNQNNRLIRVEIDGLSIAEYAYDAFERRTKKFADGVTTHYHYDLNGLLISETDGNGNPRKDYVYLNGEPVAMKVYGGSAGWYWFVNDHLGTPRKMVDESGSVVWAAAYAPFGEARIYVDEVTNNLRFPGQYYDVETGLHYNWHRYYDPETGRYLTPDPIGLDGGLNVYAYAGNDPVNFIDPLGLFVQLMGSSEQQQYTLNQLKKFIRGTLSIGDNGMLSRRPCQKDEGIESDIDELIKSSNLYRVHPTIDVETGFGRSHTVPFIEGGGADIYFDPSVNARYATGFLSSSPFTPAAELAHEILGRATQIEKGIPHGKMGSETRRSSNHRAVQKANAAFIRMGMKPRTSYQR